MNTRWNEEDGIAEVTIQYKDMFFTGTAMCHTQDMDMKSEKTGCAIAEQRALIKIYQYVKNVELKPAITTLEHLLSTMKDSKNYNPNSYEAKRINRELEVYKDELKVTKSELKELQDGLRERIRQKDEFYKIVRKRRDNGQKTTIN